jgi:hypothetical protein
MPPVEQPRFEDVCGWVDRQAFEGTTALIVGGSRGLGELTAKLIAAGGGHCIITYAVGHADAQAVAQDIIHGGGTCDLLAFDYRKDAEAQLQALPTRPTHLYYFATTQIFRQKSSLYSAGLLREYLAVYADTFYDLCRVLADKEKPLTAFYPSSVAVEDRPRDMTEYAMAKNAGETLCADITAFLPGVRVVMQRLPRLLTDQTATTTPVETVPAQDVMKPIVLEMQGIAS